MFCVNNKLLTINRRQKMEKETEIKILKDAVKALTKMIYHYRSGKTTMPEWVFENIAEAKAFYDTNDLTKI